MHEHVKILYIENVILEGPKAKKTNVYSTEDFGNKR